MEEEKDLVKQPSFKDVAKLIKIDQFDNSYALLTKIEKKISELADDEVFAKDPTFLIDSHATIARSVSSLIEAKRRLLDTMVHSMGLFMPPASESPKPEKPENGTVSSKEVEESLKDSMLS